MNRWKKDIAGLRREHETESLLESSVEASPILQFEKWFTEALKSNVPEANAFVLSTCTSKGKPSARVVLLKELDEKGFAFYTNYKSRKGKELAENSFAAMTFYWHTLSKQIRVEGIVKKVSAKESDEYFNTRPKGSQAGAYASPQSHPISRHELDENYAALLNEYKNKDIPRPVHWGGYRIQPYRMEFWQSRKNRLHDRIVYILAKNKWKIERIAP